MTLDGSLLGVVSDQPQPHEWRKTRDIPVSCVEMLRPGCSDAWVCPVDPADLPFVKKGQKCGGQGVGHWGTGQSTEPRPWLPSVMTERPLKLLVYGDHCRNAKVAAGARVATRVA